MLPCCPHFCGVHASIPLRTLGAGLAEAPWNTAWSFWVWEAQPRVLSQHPHLPEKCPLKFLGSSGTHWVRPLQGQGAQLQGSGCGDPAVGVRLWGPSCGGLAVGARLWGPVLLTMHVASLLSGQRAAGSAAGPGEACGGPLWAVSHGCSPRIPVPVALLCPSHSKLKIVLLSGGKRVWGLNPHSSPPVLLSFTS